MFASLANWAGIERNVTVEGRSDKVVVRLHQGESGLFAWFVNYDRDNAHEISARIAQRFGTVESAVVLWGEGPATVRGGRNVVVTVPPQNAIVVSLK